jgi:thioredoxin 1
MKKWIAASLLLALVLTALPGCSGDTDKQKADNKRTAGSAVGKKVTFVELGSVKCIPCKMMQPIMKAIEEEYGKDVDVVFHDVWTADGEPYGRKYGIRAIPTQVFLDAEGKEFFRHEGYYPKDEIVKVLKTRGVGR